MLFNIKGLSSSKKCNIRIHWANISFVSVDASVITREIADNTAISDRRNSTMAS